MTSMFPTCGAIESRPPLGMAAAESAQAQEHLDLVFEKTATLPSQQAEATDNSTKGTDVLTVSFPPLELP